jgi:hypothetical protein
VSRRDQRREEKRQKEIDRSAKSDAEVEAAREWFDKYSDQDDARRKNKD